MLSSHQEDTAQQDLALKIRRGWVPRVELETTPLSEPEVFVMDHSRM